MRLIFVSLLLLACRRSEYGLVSPDKYIPDEDSFQVSTTDGQQAAGSAEEGSWSDEQDINPDDIVPNMRIDAAIQHMGWGEQQTRCQIQISFNRRWQEPQNGESQNQNPPPERPDEAGECIFNREERPDSGGQNPGPEDNWYISGDLFGPQELYLHSLEQTIVLERTQAEDGLIRYEMTDCRQETFPFAEVFDLEIPASSGADSIPEAYIEEVVAFGPNSRIETPDDLEPNEQYHGYASDGLYFSWSFDDDVPELMEERLSVQLTNNGHIPDWNYNESMHCLPDSTQDIVLTGNDLLQFTLNDYIGEGAFSIGLNIHGDYYGPDRSDPWGNIFQTRVNITRGGMLELVE